MSSSCIEEVNLEDNQWYRIVQEMLSKADIEINGTRSWDIRIATPDFFKR
ncbi:MAG TPA: cyclopropane-fatty-acyl-phospholipid synthase, partial [Erwinia persicina]|nr:cyclopropane-fatty-acyl-phospholipid synthase [Erwinia persicina]